MIAGKRILLGAWIFLILSACTQAKAQAEIPVTLPTTATTESVPSRTQTVQPPANEPTPAPWMQLEPITAANAERIALLSRIGAGTFNGFFKVSPDGETLAVATAGGIRLYQAENGREKGFIALDSAPRSLAFSPQGKQLAETHLIASEEIYQGTELAGERVPKPVLAVYEPQSGSLLYRRSLSGQDCGEYAAVDLIYSADGQWIFLRDSYSLLGFASVSNLCLLAAADGHLVRKIALPDPWFIIAGPFLSPDGQKILTLALDKNSQQGAQPRYRLQSYDFTTGSPAADLPLESTGWIYSAALSADGAWLALAGEQGALLISTADGSRVATLEHPRGVMGIAFSGDGKSLALGDQDGTVGLWSVPDGTSLWLTAGSSLVCAIAFAPDGPLLFTLGSGFSISVAAELRALQVNDGQELYRISDAIPMVRPGVSTQADRVAWGGFADGRVEVWSIGEKRELFELAAQNGTVRALCFSPDGTLLATGGEDGTIRLWQAADGTAKGILRGHTGRVEALAFSGDGGRLISAGADGSLRLWKMDGGELLAAYASGVDELTAHSLFFSLDGRTVLAAYGCPYAEFCPPFGGGSLQQLDLESGQSRALIGYDVYEITLSAAQDVYGAFSRQGIEMGWLEGEGSQSLAAYRSPLGTGALAGAAISPDGSLFFADNVFGLHVWDVPSGEMLALIKDPTGLFVCGQVTVLPGGRLLIMDGSDGTISLWGILAEE